MAAKKQKLKKRKSKVRIERWKKKNVITARDNKGRFIAWKTKTKTFTIKKAKTLFKDNRSFSKTTRTVVLKNVIEVQDFSKMPRRPSKDTALKIQYFIEGRLKDGSIVAARSLQYNIDFSKDKMRDEAFENFFYRLADSQGFDYTKEAGEEYFAEFKDKIQIKEGFVYYKANPNAVRRTEAEA